MEEEQPGQGVPGANTVVTIPEFDVEAARTELATRGIFTYTKDFPTTYELGQHNDDPVIGPLEAKIVSTRTKKFYEDLERDILESTGEPKLTPQEKAYDYLKRVAGKQKTTIEALRAETPDLNAIAATHQTEIQNLTKAHQHERFLDKLEVTVSQFDPPVPEGVSDAEATAYKEQIRNLISSAGQQLSYRFEGSQLVITKDGEDLTDVKSGKPLPLSKVLGDQFKTLVKKPEAAPTGTGTVVKPAPVGGKSVPKTEAELHTEMENEGLSPLTNPTQWGNELRKRATGYGIKISGRSPIAV